MRILVLVVALLVGLVVVVGGVGCAGVDTDPLTDGAIAQLIDMGWRGDPTDGREALYAPWCGRN